MNSSMQTRLNKKRSRNVLEDNNENALQIETIQDKITNLQNQLNNALDTPAEERLELAEHLIALQSRLSIALQSRLIQMERRG